jgi:HEAT repeat protein
MTSLSILVPVLMVVALSWVALTFLVLFGRAVHDRRRKADGRHTEARLERALRHAGAHRGERAKWRRVAGLRALGRSDSPAARSLLKAALSDADRDVAGAAVKALGEAGTAQDWAVGALVGALEQGNCPRSRIAAQLDRLAPRAGVRLLPLLDHPEAEVRFWAVTLLASYDGFGSWLILRRTCDHVPDVRAAAAETLGAINNHAGMAAVLRLLNDQEWFVRVHACRAAAALGGSGVAPQLAPLLADDHWWVRKAAKDGLRMIGTEAISSLTPMLHSPDRFARNGAAEVLQDLGVVDWLAREEPESNLLRRIWTAGGERLRAASIQRAGIATGDTLKEVEAA